MRNIVRNRTRSDGLRDPGPPISPYPSPFYAPEPSITLEDQIRTRASNPLTLILTYLFFITASKESLGFGDGDNSEPFTLFKPSISNASSPMRSLLYMGLWCACHYTFTRSALPPSHIPPSRRFSHRSFFHARVPVRPSSLDIQCPC